jgi:bifunctional DNase/RNase
MDRVTLSVLGLSTSQSQSGAYALILQEEEGQARIPIIIGATEAQSIAIALEGLAPPRPLTHDLFLNLTNAFNISLLEVEIFKLEEGIFYSKMTYKKGSDKVVMDARTSDAVALAIRFNAPIYMSQTVLEKAGIVMDASETSESESKAKPVESLATKKERLNKDLQEAIKNEDYEKAATIKDALKKLDESTKA